MGGKGLIVDLIQTVWVQAIIVFFGKTLHSLSVFLYPDA